MFLKYLITLNISDSYDIYKVLEQISIFLSWNSSKTTTVTPHICKVGYSLQKAWKKSFLRSSQVVAAATKCVTRCRLER